MEDLKQNDNSCKDEPDIKNEDKEESTNNLMNMFKIKNKQEKIKNNNKISNDDDNNDDINDSDSDDGGGLFQKHKNSKKNDDDDLFDTENKNNWDDEFMNPSEELDEFMNNTVEIKSQMKGKRTTTVIVGLKLSKENEKIFLTKIKKKMALSGSKKKVFREEIEGGSYRVDKSKRGKCKPKDPEELEAYMKNKVEIYLFTGECKEEVKQILIKDFDISEDSIIC